MANENIFAAVEALGDQILQYKRYAEDQDAQIKYLEHEVKGYQGIVCGLERERDDALKKVEKAQRVDYVPCVLCKAFEAVAGNPAFRYRCRRWDIRFTEFDGALNPHHFSCPYFEKREGAE